MDGVAMSRCSSTSFRSSILQGNRCFDAKIHDKNGRVYARSSSRENLQQRLVMVGMAILCMVRLKGSEAYQNFTVGDGEGWGVSSAKANASFYQSWATGKNFTLGDFLLFSYPSMDENVVVSRNESTYESCDVYGSSVSEVWGEAGNSSFSAVPLINTGLTFFMSGAESGDSCRAGVRFAINVTYGDGLPPGFVLPSPPSDDDESGAPDNVNGGGGTPSSFDDILLSPPPPPPPSSSSYSGRSQSSLLGLLFLSGVLFLFPHLII